jgi:hypothetical protein
MLSGFLYSRDFNGKHLVYSFHIDENIYVTNIETDEVKKIPVRSKYINISPSGFKLKKYPDIPDIACKMLLETSCYGNLLYDKYRKCLLPVYADWRGAEKRYGSHSGNIMAQRSGTVFSNHFG